MLIVILGVILKSFSTRVKPPSYSDLAQQLVTDIETDLRVIHNLIDKVDKAVLRNQLRLICEDITILLHKVAEKSPQSQLTTGRFIRGNVDFILNDILPQYIEMQDTPRFFTAPNKKMADGRAAIGTFGQFLHKRIVKLELADDMRYDVAIEMLRALDGYTSGKHNHSTELIKEKDITS
jgi:hypothetical protein